MRTPVEYCGSGRSNSAAPATVVFPSGRGVNTFLSARLRWRSPGSFLTDLRFFEPEALAVGLQDVDAVGEAVQQGAGQPFGAEHLGPGLERQVGGDDQAEAFVGAADDLEEQLGADLGEGDVAELVQDEQLATFELGEEPLRGPLLPRLEQLS